MITNDTPDLLADIAGEMRETGRDKPESMEVEGITCIPIDDVRIKQTEHYNIMCRLVYEGRWQPNPGRRDYGPGFQQSDHAGGGCGLIMLALAFPFTYIKILTIGRSVFSISLISWREV